jgi:hypothetical protein
MGFDQPKFVDGEIEAMSVHPECSKGQNMTEQASFSNTYPFSNPVSMILRVARLTVYIAPRTRFYLTRTCYHVSCRTTHGHMDQPTRTPCSRRRRRLQCEKYFSVPS